MQKFTLSGKQLKKYQITSDKSSKIKEIQEKFNQIYKTKYNKIDPGSIKYLEFKTLHKNTSKDAIFWSKSPKPKDPTLVHLKKDHIPQKNIPQIFDLPKHPWGNHVSYNDHQNFTKEHFFDPEYPQKSKLDRLDRKIRLFRKVLNKKTYKEYLDLDKSKNLMVYKTNSGVMICKKDFESEQMYEDVNKKFKKIREFTFENSTNLVSTLSQLRRGKSPKASTPDDVFKRLYTPSPTTSKMSRYKEKYKELFDSDTETKE